MAPCPCRDIFLYLSAETELFQELRSYEVKELRQMFLSHAGAYPFGWICNPPALLLQISMDLQSVGITDTFKSHLFSLLSIGKYGRSANPPERKGQGTKPHFAFPLPQNYCLNSLTSEITHLNSPLIYNKVSSFISPYLLLTPFNSP